MSEKISQADLLGQLKYARMMALQPDGVVETFYADNWLKGFIALLNLPDLEVRGAINEMMAAEEGARPGSHLTTVIGKLFPKFFPRICALDQVLAFQAGERFLYYTFNNKGLKRPKPLSKGPEKEPEIS